MNAKMMRNVELVSLAIDEAGFASLRIRDRDTGDVYTVPGGYVPLVEGGLPTADVRFESYRDGEAWRFSATHIPTGVRVGAHESRERALQALHEAVQPTGECSWCVAGAALDQPCVCPEPCGFTECLRDPEIRKRVMKAAFPLSNGKTWAERRND